VRLNKFIAQSTGISRRAADAAIAAGRVRLNSAVPIPGSTVSSTDTVTLDGAPLAQPDNTYTTIMMNKPVGYVCSRNGQGSQTIYDLLPPELHHLKPVGRLDKHSSGLLLLTDDGTLAHQLTHPSFAKTKVYKIALNQPLSHNDQLHVQNGVTLDDGVSKLELSALNATDQHNWKVTMTEGRNRQIRRTFAALGYNVVKLHRTHFGPYTLKGLLSGNYTDISVH
jgi:23S rRNA pseudouridine2605 synthase